MYGSGAALGVNLDRDAYLESRILASFDHGPTSQSNPTPIFEMSLSITVEKTRCRAFHYGRNSNEVTGRTAARCRSLSKNPTSGNIGQKWGTRSQFPPTGREFQEQREWGHRPSHPA